MLIRACMCLLLLLVPSIPARADLGAALPCSEQQLDDALRARAPDVERGTVRVTPSEGGFLVAVGLKTKTVDLAGAQGAEAARVLAMIVAELAQGETRPARVAPSPAALPERSSAPHRLHQGADRAYVSLDGLALHGVRRWDAWGVDAGLGGAIVWRQRLLWLARASYWGMPSQAWPRGNPMRSSALAGYSVRLTAVTPRFDALSLRAGPGVRIWKVDLGLMAILTRYWTGFETIDRGIPGLLGGLAISASLWLPVSKHVRLGVRAHGDIYGRRRSFVAGNYSVLEIPALAFGLGFGLAWGWT